FRWAVKKVARMIDPRLIVLTETELWPNFLNYAESAGVPVVIINGRISPSSYRSYRIIRNFFSRFTGAVKVFGMQSEEYRKRIIDLGVDAGKVVVSGNIKYDAIKIEKLSETELRDLKSEIGLPPANKVIVGGSTHSGEEEILIDIFLKMRKSYKDLSLIIAPRNIERAPSVNNLAKAKGLSAVLKTGLGENKEFNYDVIILDTIGELSRIYAIADAVFVGKSLTASGGQNILEPARWGKAVIFGPNMDNFVEEANALLEGRGAIQVSDANGLELAVKELLEKPDQIEAIGRNAANVVERFRVGIIERNMSLVKENLE
ncbi:3-deoxy-D-manno-octulosonic acid transferase, partial [Candidatus Auribacterota bacterium]